MAVQTQHSKHPGIPHPMEELVVDLALVVRISLTRHQIAPTGLSASSLRLFRTVRRGASFVSFTAISLPHQFPALKMQTGTDRHQLPTGQTKGGVVIARLAHRYRKFLGSVHQVISPG